MNKQQIYDYLLSRNIWHEITEHGAVYNMAELSEMTLPYPEADAKNLFVRDDRKENYYLLCVKGDKRVNLKDFKRKYGTRTLSFATAEELSEMLGLIPGAVTPLGLLNQEARNVQFYLDSYFTGGLIGVHPNDNTATLWLKTADLVEIIRDSGHEVHIAEL